MIESEVSRLQMWISAGMDHNTCPVRQVLAPVLGKWTLLLLVILEDSPRRFGELARFVPDISRRMLSHSLRELESDGLVSRHALDMRPPGVEYRITQLGQSFMTALTPALDWANANVGQIMAARQHTENADHAG